VQDGWTSSYAETPLDHQVYVRTPLADLTFAPLETTMALPDLTAALGAIPGGLGAEVAESFVYAGQEWTSIDAHATGTPIGMQLAMEQRGLGIPEAGRYVPDAGRYQNAGPGRRRASV
jgi:hypothetical protein